MIDMFQNVYGSTLPESYRPSIFSFQVTRNDLIEQKDKTTQDTFEKLMNPVCSKYGVTIETFPDYFTDGKGEEGGFVRLIDKYGETFEKLVVNGKSALG